MAFEKHEVAPSAHLLPLLDNWGSRQIISMPVDQQEDVETVKPALLKLHHIDAQAFRSRWAPGDSPSNVNQMNLAEKLHRELWSPRSGPVAPNSMLTLDHIKGYWQVPVGGEDGVHNRVRNESLLCHLALLVHQLFSSGSWTLGLMTSPALLPHTWMT